MPLVQTPFHTFVSVATFAFAEQTLRRGSRNRDVGRSCASRSRREGSPSSTAGIVVSVAETLFAERFAVSADAPAHPDSAAHLYDETRNLTVTPDGLPAVERGITASTDTGTYAGREPPDSDRAWEAAASTDTLTKAGHDRDHWSASASTDTITRARSDRDLWTR